MRFLVCRAYFYVAWVVVALTANAASTLASGPSFETFLRLLTTPGSCLTFPSKSIADSFSFRFRLDVHTPPPSVGGRSPGWTVNLWVWRDKDRCVLFAKIGNGDEVYNSISRGHVLDVLLRSGAHDACWSCHSGNFSIRLRRKGTRSRLVASFFAYQYPVKPPVAFDLGSLLSPHTLKTCASLSYNSAARKIEVEQPGRPGPIRTTILFSKQPLSRKAFPLKMIATVSRSSAGDAAMAVRFWDFRLGSRTRRMAFHAGVGSLRKLGVTVKGINNAMHIVSAVYAPNSGAVRMKLSKASLARRAIFERWAGLTELKDAATGSSGKPGALSGKGRGISAK